jgi:hypothetical protein
MMDPKFERVHVLAEAIRTAAHELDDPIDAVTLSGATIFVAAGSKRVELSYYYQNAYAQDGSSMPGSGHWIVSIVHPAGKSRLAALMQSIRRRVAAFKGQTGG